MRPPQNRRDV
jgi:hypothetical protein